jgi:hypothetical protein
MGPNCGKATCSKNGSERCGYLYENPLTGKAYCMKFNEPIVEMTPDECWVKRLPECLAKDAQ